MACSSCEIYQKLDSLAGTYSRQTFDVVAASTIKFYGVVVTLWLLWQLGVNWLYKGDIDKVEAAKTFVCFLVVGLFLKSSGYYWEYVYDPIYSTTIKLAQAVISASLGQAHGDRIESMLQIVETELGRIFDLQKMISADASFYQVPTMIGGMVLVLPFVFIWGLFLAYTVDAIFSFLVISALAPLYILCAAFPSFRGFSISALRVVLQGCLTLVFASVAMGFTIAVLKHFMATVPINASGATEGAASWVFSKEYWNLFLIGFISILFHLKASSIAGVISGAGGGPGTAGAVVGAAMMAAGVAQMATSKVGGKAMELGGDGADALLRKTKTGKYAFAKPGD